MKNIDSDYNFTFLDKGKKIISKISNKNYVIGGVSSDDIIIINIDKTAETNDLYYHTANVSGYVIRDEFDWKD